MRRCTTVVTDRVPLWPVLSRRWQGTDRVSAKLQPVNFDDPTVYRSRSLWYLIKALFILRMCSIPYVALNSVSLMQTAERFIGTTLTYRVFVKHTIYSHFCAGENEKELAKTLKALRAQNIGACLDYAAEADVAGFAPSPGAEEAPNVSMASLVTKPSVRYVDRELEFEENMKLYMISVLHAARSTPSRGPNLVAVKVSGMCDPQLLARISAILLSIHQSWCVYFTQEDQVPKLEECRVVMGVKQKHQLYITVAQLRDGFDRYSANRLSDEQFDQVLAVLDPKKEGRVSYYAYKQVLTDAIIAPDPTPTQKILIERLPVVNAQEKRLWEALYRRVELITSTAKSLHVRVLVDAEQTFYQLAIDAVVARLQREYNKSEPVVYNTYQCYLTYAEDRISNDLTRAAELGFQWGGKVVRGAYMLQERQTAQQYDYTSPIWPTYEETGRCYHDCARRILATMEQVAGNKYEVLFGTHNRQSLAEVATAVGQRPSLAAQVLFGQLFAMRDNLTIPLAKAGYSVYKYVPYGPVKETIHYLGRRAVENASVLSTQDSDEMTMMRREIVRRLTLR